MLATCVIFVVGRRMFDATLAMARAGNKKMEDVDMQLLEEQGEGVWKREREGRREGERGKGGGGEGGERRMFDATLAMARAGSKKMEDVNMRLLEEQGEGVWKRGRRVRRE